MFDNRSSINVFILFVCRLPMKDLSLTQYLFVTGLSVPVPRGRKGKKLKNQLNVPEAKNADWMVHCNPEVVLHDESYKKHLKQHCNKLVDSSLFLDCNCMKNVNLCEPYRKFC